ncbi:MAG: endonuclease [Muribaculaceae bacterium]|nr:endonuclease [Muribaculaceae bacterium]
MKKKIFAASLVLCACVGTQAAVPTGYYSSLPGKSGQALKTAVHDIVAHHTVLSYGDLWKYYPDTDARPENSRLVWDMYSNETYYFNSTYGHSTSGMNKEHSFPKSWWGGSTSVDAYSDLHHLVPVDAASNTARSNWPFGEVATENWNNGLSKRGTPKSGQGGGASNVFEPADEYKGDFARIYFYMVSCYQDYSWSSSYLWMLSNTDWRSLSKWSMDLLMKWSREDPVSEKEIKRNDAVFRYQNNRNPFVDNPDLAEYIWGKYAGNAYKDTTSVTPPPQDPTLITPTQGTLLNFGEVKLGESATLTLYVTGKYLTSNLSLQLYRYDYRMFSLSTTTIDYEQVNSDGGYALKITYAPTEMGDHKAKILISDGGLPGSVGIDLQATCVSAGLRGDVNGDGHVDVADVNAVVNIVLGNSQSVPLADVNGDGEEDVADVNTLINIVLGND